MGGGRASTPLTKQQLAAMKAERERQRRIRAERARSKKAIKNERDAWIKNYREKTGDSGWGFLGWPLQWWRERRAWEEELQSRAYKRGSVDTELTGLTSEDSGYKMGSGSGAMVVNGAENGDLRKRSVM
jgi:hypothetical protein